MKVTATVVTQEPYRIVNEFFATFDPLGKMVSPRLMPGASLKIVGNEVKVDFDTYYDKFPGGLLKAICEAEIKEFYCEDDNYTRVGGNPSEKSSEDAKPTKQRKTRKTKKEKEKNSEPMEAEKTGPETSDSQEPEESVSEEVGETASEEAGESEPVERECPEVGKTEKVVSKKKPKVPEEEKLDLNELCEDTKSFDELIYIIGKKLNGITPELFKSIVTIALSNPNLVGPKVLDKMNIKRGLRVVIGKSSTAVFGCNFNQLLESVRLNFLKRVNETLTNMGLNEVVEDKKIYEFVREQILKDFISEDDMDAELRIKLGMYTIHKDMRAIEFLEYVKKFVFEDA